MKYYEDKSDRKMELKLLPLSEDDKLIRECMEQASAFYGCLGKMGVTEILCDRKKAQELGADCQITGIFTGGELTAFACAFEYTGLKRNGRKWLNPGDKEWRQIETLGTNVVVIPLLVGKEKVGRLIELLREQYRDSHLLFRISGEQSEKFQEDLAVVSEKNLKSHRYDAAGENVWLFHFAPQIRMEDTYFEEEILLILPGQEVLLEMGIEEAEVTMVKLTGYEIVRSEKGSAFFRKPGAACEGVLLQCDYEQLLRYQRFINLAVFADESPIVAGNYTLDVSGADSIQIYYEPDVKFEAGLYKGDTKMEEGTIEGGAYTVKVGFVDQLSGKYIKSSKLLGEPKYTVSINGETQELTGKDGASQSIDVEVDGESLELTADVNYLKDYTDSASYTFKVCTLDINVDAFKSANLKTLEDGANQITVEATRNDQPLTKEQWDAATLDVVSVNKDGEEFGIQWDVQKGSEVSTWIVTPKYKKGGMFATETGQADVTINVSAEIDGDGYGKAETVSVNIKDDKNIVDYLKRYWKHIVISLLLLILILGYVPPFKKRFARSIKKRPSIECSAEKIGLRDNVMKGNFEKDLASRLLPYVPETGRLTFSPTPVKKTAKVRASGGGSMLILNTSAFAGKEEITFNGMSIQENEKGHHRISASTIIVVSTPEFTYTCIPNVQRTANGEIKRGKRK